jgi:hypothetical protein
LTIRSLETDVVAVTPEEVGAGISAGETRAETFVRRAWPVWVTTVGLPPSNSATSVVAVVNHGRWLVRCPNCAGAQLASRADQRFFCVEPLCPALLPSDPPSRRWLLVTWPSTDDIATVEALLDRRPDEQTRNFEPPSETIADLQAENAAMGL